MTGTDGTPGRWEVGLLTDPDRPTELVHAVTEHRLPRALREALGGPDGADDDHPYVVHARQCAIAAGRGTMSDVLDTVRAHRDREGWDLAVYVTDVPIVHRREPVVADVSTARGVAVLCLPALGGIWLRSRMLRVVVELVATLSRAERPVSSAGAVGRSLAPTQRHRLDDVGVDERLAVPPVRGHARLFAGMIRTNHPGRLVSGMATAFGATVAASAFMIFNSSSWLIALTAGPVRLVLAAVAGALLLTVWIITRHGLWERAESDGHLTLLYNLATTATIGQAVLALVAATFLVDLGAVAVLVSGEALTATALQARGRPPAAIDWFSIAALATVAATLAGSLGVALHREEDVRNAAYGYRQREHRRGAPARLEESQPDD